MSTLLMKLELDGLDSLAEVHQFVTQLAKSGWGGSDILSLASADRHLAKMILWETESARDGRERGAGALPVRSLLDLPQRRGGDSRLLGKLPLGYAPLPHPVVDHLRDGRPITHVSLLTTR